MKNENEILSSLGSMLTAVTMDDGSYVY